MLSLESINQRISQAFEALEFPSAPAELYDPIVYTLNLGGKRLRPLLVLASCDMFGGNAEDAINPAVGLELFHNFTLLHDDIMDQAPLRRGKETVYKKWNANIAILSGDTMFAMANCKMLQTIPAVVPALVELFNITAVEVCEGQQYDMNFESLDEVSLADYLEMIRLKTAVLLAASLKSGAMIAGAGKAECDLIYRFGINTGLAFQLMDDLLDVYSNEAVFGKMSGGDIVSGKKTFLYLKALEIAGNEAADFKKIYQSTDLIPAEKIQQVKTYFDTFGIYALTRQEIAGYWENALGVFKKIGLPEAHSHILLSYCARLMDRKY